MFDVRTAAETLPSDWQEQLRGEFEKGYWRALQDGIAAARRQSPDGVFPAPEKVFAAFELSSFEATKVVILGQDPYHGPGQANGLAFSVPVGVKVPPALHKIYTNLESDPAVDFRRPAHGDLTCWAEQGVLLLNTSLTVARNAPGSHLKAGWRNFTDQVITALARKSDPVVFLLWGQPARRKRRLIAGPSNRVSESAHPTAWPSASDPFLGVRHFSSVNEFMESHGRTPIRWQLPQP